MMDAKPVTAADRQAAILARAAAEREAQRQPAALDLPPPPFDAQAGYRAFKKQMREDAAAKPGSLWTSGTVDDRAINPVDWAAKPVPPRLWVVDQWIPLGVPTAIYGDGGTGKSLIGQGLMTSCALRAPWLGIATPQCRSFGYFCEDEEDELHRRQDAINRALGCDHADLEAMRLQSRVGMDNVLMAFGGDGVGVFTPAFDNLCAEVMDHKARLCIIDTAADTFGGNENIRPQVRQFVGHCLGKLAKMMRGAVVLLAHPSRSGLASGEGDGASTAWNASVRSRLYLSRPKAEGDEAPDDDRRILTRKKANYASRGDAVDLLWHDGYFKVEHEAAGIFGTIERRSADQVFIGAVAELTKQGRNLSANTAANNYAPAIILRAKLADRFKRMDMADAMERALKDRSIIIEPYGPTSQGKQRIAIAPRTPPE
jgi:RecA-family ATPase